MTTVRKILIIIFFIIIGIVLLIWLGLTIKPKSFSPIIQNESSMETIPLPSDLPTPVERYYRIVYGDEIPVIETVVIQGRGIMKPLMNIAIPARFVFVHNVGKDYRHYFEATLFGLPILKINEGYLDGESFFESPMGNYFNEPKSNQGANLALWAEGLWFPSLWLTDSDVRWESLDDNTALLFVPYEDGEENFIVRFNPQTGLIDMMEAMRYRDNTDDAIKILWICQSENSELISGTKLFSSGSVMWLDQGKPWAYFNVEEMVYNSDTSIYITQRGQ